MRDVATPSCSSYPRRLRGQPIVHRQRATRQSGQEKRQHQSATTQATAAIVTGNCRVSRDGGEGENMWANILPGTWLYRPTPPFIPTLSPLSNLPIPEETVQRTITYKNGYHLFFSLFDGSRSHRLLLLSLWSPLSWPPQQLRPCLRSPYWGGLNIACVVIRRRNNTRLFIFVASFVQRRKYSTRWNAYLRRRNKVATAPEGNAPIFEVFIHIVHNSQIYNIIIQLKAVWHAIDTAPSPQIVLKQS